ncbi:MAG TPA: hypothetical protein VNH22_20930 [Blastocatellia bacterium]|jgi:hypothetical protein|nr:hypothetical protein [Blastocatellia bacterium]
MYTRFAGLIFAFTLLFSIPLAAQNRSSQSGGQPPVEEIIRRFAAAESENRIARSNYTFTQDVTFLTIGEAGSITGKYERLSEIVFDDRGTRFEKITYFPSPTLSGITVTPEDLQDLAGIQPFALTQEELPKYNVEYVGKEKADELNTYVFNVRPKQIRKGERYFEGRIWVDDQDLQIVKVAGQAVPESDDHQYPRFESYRENIDGKYWFPTYVYADDVLEFKRNSQRIRVIVKYTKYRKFSTDIRLGEGEEDKEVPAAKKPVDPNKPPEQNSADQVRPAPEKQQPKPTKKPPSELE